jgi:hypothetical protein
MTTRKDALAPLTPLLGAWSAKVDTPMGRTHCTREFASVLGGTYVELIANWEFGAGHGKYEERALFGIDPNGALAFWSFTSDGGQATGAIANVDEIQPSALGFIAQMPAGRARQAYWLSSDSVLHWVVDAETAKGWERLASHEYHRALGGES